jgi:DNA modification methylase
VIDLFAAGGFNFIGEFVICKDPQAMAQRLNLHSLMFVTGKREAQMLAPAPNDYVLIFQKPGDPEHKVAALYDKKINPDEWIRDAHGIWTDIDPFDILDGWRSARESDTEKHVCPLQLEVIRRLVKLYSNPITKQPDVTVLDPFSGIGSTGYICVEQDRNYVGFELKESYYAQSLKNIQKACELLKSQTQPLFA